MGDIIFLLISPSEIWMEFLTCNFQTDFSDWWLSCELALIWMSLELTDDQSPFGAEEIGLVSSIPCK